MDVSCGRAEIQGRDDSLRGTFDAVVSRSFGSPSVTAECGSPFLKQGGLLVVSGPPAGDRKPDQTGEPTGEVVEVTSSRWPAAGLSRLGLKLVDLISEPFHFAVLRQEELCPGEFPRRDGVPAKRPLF
jgi:16S rRNA (guanine527-N7)-methyltransferase